MYRGLTLSLLACALLTAGQEPPPPEAVPPPPSVRLEGALPAPLPLRAMSPYLDAARLPNMGPRRPATIAPSARAYGHSDYSYMPANLAFYAGLGERDNLNRRTEPLAVEVRFSEGPKTRMALESGWGEPVIGPRLARKLRLKAGRGEKVTLPEFHVGPLSIAGLVARVAQEGDLTGDALDGVLPLRLFTGFGLFFEPKGRRLTLYPEGPPPEALSRLATAVPATWEAGTLFLEVGLEGRTRGLALVDSSALHGALDLKAVERAGLPFTTRKEVFKGEIPKGGWADKARLSVGRFSVTVVTASVLDLGGALPPDGVGILGRDLLDLFGLYLQPGADELLLVPAAKQ